MKSILKYDLYTLFGFVVGTARNVPQVLGTRDFSPWQHVRNGLMMIYAQNRFTPNQGTQFGCDVFIKLYRRSVGIYSTCMLMKEKRRRATARRRNRVVTDFSRVRLK